MDSRKVVGYEPPVWFLVFREKTNRRWLSWLAMGRFKHVFAIGWVPTQRVWLVYEVFLGSTTVAVLPDGPETELMLQEMRRDTVTLAIAPRPERRRWFRFGFWCVPAMAHLVGLPCAVRPDGLFGQCLRHNAEVVDYGIYETIGEAGSDCAGGGRTPEAA